MATVCKRPSQPTWKRWEALPPLTEVFLPLPTVKKNPKKKKSRPAFTNWLFCRFSTIKIFQSGRRVCDQSKGSFRCQTKTITCTSTFNRYRYVDFFFFKFCWSVKSIQVLVYNYDRRPIPMLKSLPSCFLSGLKNLLKINFTSISTWAGIRKMCCRCPHFFLTQVFLAWTADQLELCLTKITENHKLLFYFFV